MKTESTDIKVNSRRRFLQKSSAGVVIASLPAKSVWANGIAGSIVASGNSSDWSQRNNVSLECFEADDIKTILGDTTTFGYYFSGQNPPGGSGTSSDLISDVFKTVYDSYGTSSTSARADMWMIMLLANAVADHLGGYGVVYPVLDNSVGHGSLSSYTDALYLAASQSTFSSEVESMFGCVIY